MKTTMLLSKQRFKVLLKVVSFAGLTFAASSTQVNAYYGYGSGLGAPGVYGGVVTATEAAATKIGAEVLRKGGNAIDAAAAMQFALNVVEPQSSGIGGGGFMMIYLANKRKVFVVDSREKAPAAATPDMFETQTSFSTRSTSGLAVGVPGTLLGVATALEKWGRFSLTDAIEPSIKLAEDGIIVTARLAASLQSSRLANELGDPAYDEARSVFYRDDGMPKEAGDLLVQTDLAETLKLIADQGVDAFYRGPISQAIVDTQLNTRAGNPDGVGRMTLQDLDDYEVAIRKPVVGKYRGYQIVSMPPPSSGGLTVIQIMKQLERFPIGDAEQGYGFGSTRTLNVMIESMRLSFADRAIWMGDTDFVNLPVNGLINNDYVNIRSAQIDPDSRLDNEVVVAGDPRPFDFAYNDVSDVKLASVNLPDEEGLNTTHFTVSDRRGNVVTYTSTIESGWGTGLMVPGYGFLLNNEITDFNRVPTANPDPLNFNPGANDVAANKRPRSSMAPTMIFKRGRPVAAFGSPGGSTIIDTVVDVALNLIDHDMVIQEAIDAPRIAQTSVTFPTRREIGFDEDVIAELVSYGHAFRDPSFPGEANGGQGSVQAVVFDRWRQQYGAADKRRTGSVVSVKRKEIKRRYYHY